MKVLNLLQGSTEWKAHRATAFNASDAPAMLGISKYKSRSDLIRERATGIVPEVDDATQRRFNDGHRFEALARPLAEKIIGEELSPMTGAEGKYSASFDGITFDGDVIFEHKSLNADLRETMEGIDEADRLHEQYRAQMEHQLLVSGANKCLFMASSWDENGNLIEERHCWYEPDGFLRKRIVDGWTQFENDVATYVPSEVKEMPKAEVTIELPALFVHAKGEITTHNMDEFGKALTAKLAETRAIALVTDQDFSNAKEAAKKFRDTAKAIALSKEAMLAQTDTIGEAARKMDAWAKDLNATALQLEKDVEREDKAKKEVMVLGGKNAYTEHVAALETEIKPIRLNLTAPNFAEAIKGKRNYASMQDAVDTMLADAKVTADSSAKDVRAKLTWCKEHAAGHSALFPDLQSLMAKPLEDFTLTITSRIEKAKADEAEKMEAVRVQAEAAARAKLEAEAKKKEEAEALAKAKTEAAQREADAIEERRKAVALAEQEATLAASQREYDKSLKGEPAVLQAEKPSLSVVELPSKYVRPSEEELLTCWAANFNVPYLTASAWLFELAESMKEAA